MVTRVLHAAGFRSWFFHGLSLATVAACLVLWMRAKTVDEIERANAERRALFTGLWAPTLWGIGHSLELRETRRRGVRRRAG